MNFEQTEFGAEPSTEVLTIEKSMKNYGYLALVAAFVFKSRMAGLAGLALLWLDSQDKSKVG